MAGKKLVNYLSKKYQEGGQVPLAYPNKPPSYYPGSKYGKHWPINWISEEAAEEAGLNIPGPILDIAKKYYGGAMGPGFNQRGQWVPEDSHTQTFQSGIKPAQYRYSDLISLLLEGALSGDLPTTTRRGAHDVEIPVREAGGKEFTGPVNIQDIVQMVHSAQTEQAKVHGTIDSELEKSSKYPAGQSMGVNLPPQYAGTLPKEKFGELGRLDTQEVDELLLNLLYPGSKYGAGGEWSERYGLGHYPGGPQPISEPWPTGSPQANIQKAIKDKDKPHQNIMEDILKLLEGQ